MLALHQHRLPGPAQGAAPPLRARGGRWTSSTSARSSIEPARGPRAGAGLRRPLRARRRTRWPSWSASPRSRRRTSIAAIEASKTRGLARLLNAPRHPHGRRARRPAPGRALRHHGAAARRHRGRHQRDPRHRPADRPVGDGLLRRAAQPRRPSSGSAAAGVVMTEEGHDRGPAAARRQDLRADRRAREPDAATRPRTSIIRLGGRVSPARCRRRPTTSSSARTPGSKADDAKRLGRDHARRGGVPQAGRGAREPRGGRAGHRAGARSACSRPARPPRTSPRSPASRRWPTSRSPIWRRAGAPAALARRGRRHRRRPAPCRGALATRTTVVRDARRALGVAGLEPLGRRGGRTRCCRPASSR